MFLSAAEAKKRFPEICKLVSQSGERTYVKEKSGKSALTITAQAPRQGRKAIVAFTPPIPISANAFKESFSRCSSLVKSGAVFEITLPGGRSAYVRRHDLYNDASDAYVKLWIENLQRAGADEYKAKLDTAALEALDRREIIERLETIQMGVEQIAVRHLPFTETDSPDADE
jgi:hypothetical protein